VSVPNAPPLPTTRVAAINIGAKWYFTGKPCKRGHVDRRLTSNFQCYTCGRAKIEAYRIRNRAKLSAATCRNYRENADKRRADARQKYWANPEKPRAAAVRSRIKHLEASRTRRREGYWKNRDVELAANREYRAQNAERVRSTQARRYQEHGDRLRLKSRLWGERNIARRRLRVGLPAPTRPEPTVCECCGGPPRKNSLALDHCHETGVFRGWLCADCNLAIGALGDNSIGLLHAISYLQWAESITHPHCVPPGV
jgi:hypothetical protein